MRSITLAVGHRSEGVPLDFVFGIAQQKGFAEIRADRAGFYAWDISEMCFKKLEIGARGFGSGLLVTFRRFEPVKFREQWLVED